MREIQRGIRSQAPGGQAFVKLAESTIERKGSSKALIDTGFLVNAITQKIMADKAFVGLLRGTVNKDGEDMVNIGARHGVRGHHQTSERRDHRHPRRPFLHPVMVSTASRSSRTIARRSAPRFEPPTHRQCFR